MESKTTGIPSAELPRDTDVHPVSCDDGVVGKPRTLLTKTLIIIATHPLWRADAVGKLLLSLAGLEALLPNLSVHSSGAV